VTPVRVAIIGAGQRSRTVYVPLIPSLAKFVQVVAVCDPVKANADRVAGMLGVASFGSIRELARQEHIEGAIVVTPPESHHSIVCHLLVQGIAALVETPLASTLSQAREMVRTARSVGRVLRVGENFIRTPIDRIVQKLMPLEIVGPIRRVFSYADHTGYHNNSRWVRLFGRPLWVQSITHEMPIEPFHSEPQRFHENETFVSNHFGFAAGCHVIDSMANVKGFLGRHARPGYTEWQGTRGTIIHRNAAGGWGLQHTESQIRRCSDAALNQGHGFADELYPIRHEFDDAGRWVRTWVEAGGQMIEHVNPYRPARLCEIGPGRGEYGSSVMDHIADFARGVRGVGATEFDEVDALTAMEMEAAAHESAEAKGRRVVLPLGEKLSSDEAVRAALQERLGCDPYDIQAMLDRSFPKP
jgi:predicted dehydrogenase